MGMVGWRTEWSNGGNGRNDGQNGRMAEWQNGRMAERRNGGRNGRMEGMVGMAGWRTEWLNGGNGGNGGMAKRMAEWQNGRKWIHSYTYVLFMVHVNDDNDTNDSLIFYSIEVLDIFEK